ncbi:MAG: TldD/PmbA family protein [candidate division WOR-3 bacterium]
MARFTGSDKYLRIAEDVIKASVAEVVEGAIFHVESDFARFMESKVHQYNKLNTLTLAVRVRFGKKAGMVTTTDLTKDGIIKAVKKAEEIALNAKEDPDLPEAESSKNLYFESVDQAVKDLSAEEKARFLKRLFSELENFNFYGSFRSSFNSVLIFNNIGMRAHQAYTALHLTILLEDREDRDTFWLQFSSSDLDALRFDDVKGKIARFMAMEFPDAGLKPGRYPVILAPYAVAEILDFMQYVGFSARALYDGISFLEGMGNKKVFGDNFTLVDNPLRKKGFKMPFDFEGVEKDTLKIFDRGVFKHFIYSKKMAKIFNTKSTGHAMDFASEYPYAAHLEMSPGDKGLEEMIAESQDVILINRFHYVNVLDPKSFTLTGMTRDGSFRIRNGKRWSRLPNLRFQVNFIELLNNITGISKDLEEVGFPESYGMDIPGTYILPYIRCENFNFIGVSTEES